MAQYDVPRHTVVAIPRPKEEIDGPVWVTARPELLSRPDDLPAIYDYLGWAFSLDLGNVILSSLPTIQVASNGQENAVVLWKDQEADPAWVTVEKMRRLLACGRGTEACVKIEAPGSGLYVLASVRD